MANGYELATAYVSLAVESNTIPQEIGKAFAQSDKVALNAGKKMGQAVAKGYATQKGPDFDKLAADAKKADEQVAASAEKGAKSRETSARKVEIAELKVQEVRERSIRQDAEVRAAEKSLSDARSSGDTDRVAAAEKALADAREAVKPTSADLAAEDRLAAARDSQRLATQKAEAELDGYRQAQEKANTALQEAKRTADDAETSTERAGNAFSTMGDRVKAALRLDFKGAFKGVEREADTSADQVVTEFDDAGDDSGLGMLDGLKGALLGAAGALGIGASFGEMFQQGIESVSSTAQLKASLGLSDADAQSLGRDAAGAYKAGFGEDLASATDATAAVRQYLGPDVDTQWATEMSLAMAQAFGNEPQDNIKAVAQMIRTGMVDDAQEGFDVLTRGFQSGADKAGDLTDTMTEYGTLFRNLGIDGSTSIGLMSQGLNAGARDADKVADAFKEFSIRAVDGSETTKDAFSALGLNADDMAQRIGKGGKSARDATQEVLEKLGGVEDPALRAQIAVGLFGTQAEDLGDSLYALDIDTATAGMGEIAGSTEKMSDALAEAQSPFDRIKRSFSDIGTSLGTGMLPALDIFADVIISIGEFFRANPLVLGIVAAGLTAIGVALAVMTAPTIAATFAASGLGVALASVSWPVLAVIAGITAVVGALTWFFTKTEAGQEIWAKVWGGIKAVAQGIADWFTGTLVPIFQTIWGILIEGDFKGGSALSEDSGFVGALFTIREAAEAVIGWILNTAVPWLQSAWSAIAAGAVWLYENALKPAWNGISAAIGATVDWLVNTAWPFIKGVWDGIAAAAIWLWQDVLVPAWAGISAAIGAVVGWLVNTAWPAIKGVWDAIAAAAMWLWESVLSPVWDGIRIAIAVAVTAVLAYIDLLKWYWSSVLAPVAMWLGDSVIKPVWAGIQSAIGAVVAWFTETAWPILKAAWDAVAAAAMWLWNSVLKPVWAGIQAAISAVVQWFQTVAWPIVQTVIDWISRYFQAMGLVLSWVWSGIKTAIGAVVAWFRDVAWPLVSSVVDWLRTKFDQFKLGLSIIWSFIRNNVIGPVVSWFRDTVWPIFSRIIGQIRDRFSWFRDRLGEVWSFIRDSIINPVVNWFMDTVKPKIDDFIGKVKDGFTGLKDGVLKAWDGIRDGLKKPVNGVIGIYNDHIAGNFNKVIETIFGKDGGEKYKLSEMTPFARGGILPGHSSWRDGDDQIISARRGEGMLVSEGLRDRESQSLFLRANHAARTRGTSFADFVSGAFAGGGIVKLRSPFSGSYPRGDGFGARGGRHKGIDWPMPSGAILKAVGAGSVSHSWNPSAGKKLELSIGNGLVAGYHHLSSYIAGRGAQVAAGADVARVGSTGRSSGPHLHFSLKRDGKYVDPLPYLGSGGAAGTGESGSWWNPFDGLWSSIKEKVASAVGEGTAGSMVSKVVENTIGGIGDWVTGKLGEVGDWGMEQVDGAVQGVKATRWTPVATQALSMEGALSGANLQALLRRMNQESGFNPRAVNDWDSNAAAGTPSKGLMQVIPPTFRAYARPGYDKDIFDPLSNILASIRYTRATYPSLQAGWNRKGGYAFGGIVDKPFLYDNGGWLNPGELSISQTQKPEAVLTDSQWRTMARLAEENLAEPSGGDTWNVYGADAEEAAERAYRKFRRVEALRAKR